MNLTYKCVNRGLLFVGVLLAASSAQAQSTSKSEAENYWGISVDTNSASSTLWVQNSGPIQFNLINSAAGAVYESSGTGSAIAGTYAGSNGSVSSVFFDANANSVSGLSGSGLASAGIRQTVSVTNLDPTNALTLDVASRVLISPSIFTAGRIPGGFATMFVSAGLSVSTPTSSFSDYETYSGNTVSGGLLTSSGYTFGQNIFDGTATFSIVLAPGSTGTLNFNADTLNSATLQSALVPAPPTIQTLLGGLCCLRLFKTRRSYIKHD